jgi:hypothetical protein
VGAFQSQSTSHLLLGFNGVVGFSSFPIVKTADGTTSVQGQWYAINTPHSPPSLYGTDSNSSSVWLFEPIPKLPSMNGLVVQVESNDVYTISSSMTVASNVLWKERVRTVECLGNLEKKRCKAKEG